MVFSCVFEKAIKKSSSVDRIATAEWKIKLVGGDDFDCQGDVRTGDEEHFVGRKRTVFRRKCQHQGLVSLTCRRKSKRACGEAD